MPKSEKRRNTTRQLQLVLNAEQIASLDGRSRVTVVRLLAKLLREAMQTSERIVSDDDA